MCRGTDTKTVEEGPPVSADPQPKHQEPQPNDAEKSVVQSQNRPKSWSELAEEDDELVESTTSGSSSPSGSTRRWSDEIEVQSPAQEFSPQPVAGGLRKQRARSSCIPQEPVSHQRKALSVRALRSRLQTTAAVPTWAAWLPSALQQPAYTNTSQMMDNSSSADMMSTNGTYDVATTSTMMSAAATCFTPEGFYIDTEQWAPTGDGCYMGPDGQLYQAMVFPTCQWTDPEDQTSYFPGAQLEQNSTRFDVQAQEESFSVANLTGNVWKQSKLGNGCRLVQQAFDDSETDEARMALTSELRGHVWEALKCQNANHVIQKCISVIRPAAAQFVIDELMQRGGGAAQAARHRFGCRIIERLLEHCGEEQVSPLVNELVADTLALSSHVYGNYVVQHLLEHCSPDVVSAITSILEQNACSFAGDGYAGSVIGKALSHASEQEAQTLAKSLLKNPDHLVVMACSRWGHVAVKLALKLADASNREKTCAELTWRSNRLRSSRYGRLVANAVAEQQQSLLPICEA